MPAIRLEDRLAAANHFNNRFKATSKERKNIAAKMANNLNVHQHYQARVKSIKASMKGI